MTDLVDALQECYRDKLADLLRHEAGARVIATYDFNNAYQYTINREETQLSWLANAIRDLDGSVPAEVGTPLSAVSRQQKSTWRAVVEEDLRQTQVFVEKWGPRADAMVNARQRGLLRVILGETLEQKRLFEQVLSGQTDLLGRRGDEVGPVVGEVLPARWVE